MEDAVQTEARDVTIETPGGVMPAFLCSPTAPRRRPAVLVLMEAFGLTGHIRSLAERIAGEGYVAIVPDLYWRSLPDNKFGYDQVEEASALMFALDHADVLADLRASVSYLGSIPEVDASAIGVTGFCMGGGFTFLSACTMSKEIAAAAPFYGMVADEWIEAAESISVPIYLFFGDADPYIPIARIDQIETRLAELGKPFRLKVYPGADHGFFCNERASYNRCAAEDSWQELTRFFAEHLQKTPQPRV